CPRRVLVRAPAAPAVFPVAPRPPRRVPVRAPAAPACSHPRPGRPGVFPFAPLRPQRVPTRAPAALTTFVAENYPSTTVRVTTDGNKRAPAGASRASPSLFLAAAGGRRCGMGQRPTLL